MATSAWTTFGASVRGATHRRRSIPNQDALLERSSPSDLPFVVVAVADGHGSERSFRSDVGSRLAVAAAETEIDALLSSGGIDALIGATTSGLLAQQIVRTWRAAVGTDLEESPLTSAEAQLGAGDNRFVAYGSTLLAAAGDDTRIVINQIGDGDVVAVDTSGGVVEPIPVDDRLIANETTSLCQTSAPDQFRHAVIDLADTPLDLVMLSTDGLSNSYRERAGFHRVATDIHAQLLADGAAMVESRLPGWLTEFTSQGSGDDITLAAIWRPGPVTAHTGPVLAEDAVTGSADGLPAGQAGSVAATASSFGRGRGVRLFTLALGIIVVAALSVGATLLLGSRSDAAATASWAAGPQSGQIIRLHPDPTIATLNLPAVSDRGVGAYEHDGVLWLATASGHLIPINPATMERLDSEPIKLGSPIAVIAGRDSTVFALTVDHQIITVNLDSRQWSSASLPPAGEPSMESAQPSDGVPEPTATPVGEDPP